MYNINWDEILCEAKKYLIELIKINTTNPPGSELPAAEYLQNILQKENISLKLILSEKNRGNLIAKISAENRKEDGLMLLSHLDVVPAEESKWDIPPFSGHSDEKFVYGRGALDCKSLVVQQVMIMLLIKRLGIKLKRDLIFAATSDEEKGGNLGINYLLENHKNELSVKYVITEGGGVGLSLLGKRLYLLSCAEKGILWFKIRTYGTAGHASIPIVDNSVLHLSKIIDKLSKYPKKFRITHTTENMMKEICNSFKIPYILIKVINSILINLLLNKVNKSGFVDMIKATLLNTITPTVLKAGTKTNVIPSEAEAEIDCRILPGETKDKILEEIKNYLSEFKFDIEVIEYHPPTESYTDNSLFDTIVNVMQNYDNSCKILPFMLTGATDSRFLRNAGMLAYGFSPFIVEGNYSEYIKMVHGHNEKISLDNLLFGIKTLFDITVDFCKL